MRKHLVVILMVVLLLGGTYLIGHDESQHRSTRQAKSPSQTQTAPKPSFNKTLYSIDNPASLWVVVDKLRPLQPTSYTPAHLVVPAIPARSNITGDEKYVRSDTAVALERMAAAAQGQGIIINLQSGYRSYDFQTSLYDSYVKQQGQAQADQESARAGYSEHQTGLAADLGGTSDPLCNVEQCFSTTVEGKWLAANAYRYGFIIRYPQGQQAATGYEYEPWHVRYVGVALSTEMHNQNTPTLEAFFGLPPAPDYKK